MIASDMSLFLVILTGGRRPTQCFATFANQSEKVGLVKKTATIGKRIACIFVVEECVFRELSVVSALRLDENVQWHLRVNFYG